MKFRVTVSVPAVYEVEAASYQQASENAVALAEMQARPMYRLAAVVDVEAIRNEQEAAA